jgi:hypothetical protein
LLACLDKTVGGSIPAKRLVSGQISQNEGVSAEV